MSSFVPKAPATLGDTLPPRVRWADLADSSQEASRDDTAVPPAPVVDNSYDEPAAGVENAKDSLNSRLAKSTDLQTRPIDFTSFLNEPVFKGVGASIPPIQEEPEPSANSAAASSRWNPDAPAFVPMDTHSPNSTSPTPDGDTMPPPAVPREKAKSRSRGKRPLSVAQAPAQKRTKESASSADAKAPQPAPQAQPHNTQPPEASEEEWQHRIGKRHKAINTIKDFPEYQNYIAIRPRSERLPGEPQTPVAEDRNLSKRRWEYEIQQWRTVLKQWTPDGVAEGSSTQGAGHDDLDVSPAMDEDI